MKKKTKAENVNPKAASLEENQEEDQEETEMEELRNQTLSMQELHNLKDEAYYRVRVLNNLNRIALAIENLELEDESEEEEESEEESEE